MAGTPNPQHKKPGSGQPAALRGLVGAGPSQLSASKAARARDINRPGEEELRTAEEELVIVRRHWAPQ